jgi:hypothetical protein
MMHPPPPHVLGMQCAGYGSIKGGAMLRNCVDRPRAELTGSMKVFLCAGIGWSIIQTTFVYV